MDSREIIDYMDQVTRPAVYGSLAALGGSAWSAIISPDVIPVIGGIGVGIIGIGWSIFAAGRDRRVDTLLEQIKTLQNLLSEARQSNTAGEKERRDLWVENYRLQGELAKLRAELVDPH